MRGPGAIKILVAHPSRKTRRFLDCLQFCSHSAFRVSAAISARVRARSKPQGMAMMISGFNLTSVSQSIQLECLPGSPETLAPPDSVQPIPVPQFPRSHERLKPFNARHGGPLLQHAAFLNDVHHPHFQGAQGFPARLAQIQRLGHRADVRPYIRQPAR